MEFTQQEDGMVTEMEAVLRGFAETRPIQVTL
jgi:hypothetical protein